jgi:hypothetical protein
VRGVPRARQHVSVSRRTRDPGLVFADEPYGGRRLSRSIWANLLTSCFGLERMTGIEPALSAWEAGEPTSQVVFQAQTWPFGGPGWWLFRMVGARGGPEQLIKMATGQLPDASSRRQWRHL